MKDQKRADRFFTDQVNSWPRLGENLNRLKEARIREFRFDACTIRVQFNPGRITSSSARVDRDSIARRPCFLCAGNRPPVQEGLAFRKQFEILCNPFPIFEKHFTIATREHIPQEIQPFLKEFLELSRYLSGMVVFYNAPACGASAPDHMHFQAGTTGIMPLDGELDLLISRFGKVVREPGNKQSPRCNVTAVEDRLRRFLVLESDSQGDLERCLSDAVEVIRELQEGAEPMVNILSYFNGKWRVVIFPRERHRPWQYFEEGDRNILLSPASVDMGGTLITPLEKDFKKIREADIADIFEQVSYAGERFTDLIASLKSKMIPRG